MSGAFLIALAALLPMMAVAQEMQEGRDWRDCTEDAQCVMVQGKCYPTAVNKASQVAATQYYQEKAKTAKCVERFWEPKEVEAQCRLGSCSTAAKTVKKK